MKEATSTTLVLLNDSLHGNYVECVMLQHFNLHKIIIVIALMDGD
jgi:hypothetical protein